MSISKHILIILIVITAISTICTGGILIQQHITKLGLNLSLKGELDIILGIVLGYTIAQIKGAKLDASAHPLNPE